MFPGHVCRRLSFAESTPEQPGQVPLLLVAYWNYAFCLKSAISQLRVRAAAGLPHHLAVRVVMPSDQ